LQLGPQPVQAGPHRIGTNSAGQLSLQNSAAGEVYVHFEMEIDQINGEAQNYELGYH